MRIEFSSVTELHEWLAAHSEPESPKRLKLTVEEEPKVRYTPSKKRFTPRTRTRAPAPVFPVCKDTQLVKRFIAENQETIYNLFRDQPRQTEPLKLGFSTTGISLLSGPPMLVHPVVQGVTATMAVDGKENYVAKLHGVMISGKSLGMICRLGRKDPRHSPRILNFEDPRDCSSVIIKLHALFDAYTIR